ncbi:hypothetical protein Ancab_009908 [Ancistrocladus abbreviatus]
MKRIPRIKFPQRHSKPSSIGSSGLRWEVCIFMVSASWDWPSGWQTCFISVTCLISPDPPFVHYHPSFGDKGAIGSGSQPSVPVGTHQLSTSKSDVPRAPSNSAVGGKASLQPKRTPVTDREIEAILLGGCI